VIPRLLPVALMLLCSVAALGARHQPPVRVAFIYPGGESIGPVEIVRATRAIAVDLTIFAPGSGGVSLTETTDLTVFDLVFVDASTTGLARHRSQLRAAAAATRVVVVGESADVAGNISLADHPSISAYWQQPSQDNYSGLVRYLAARVLDRPLAGPVPPPIAYPAQGFYHPDAPALFESLAAFMAWEQRRSSATDRLSIGLYFNLTSYEQKNLDHVDTLIRAIEARGQRPVALAYKVAPKLSALLVGGTRGVDVLMFAGSLLQARDREAALMESKALGVPILGALHHNTFNEAEYHASVNGLHPSLTAPVVLGEQEGRIEPIVVSGRGAPNGDRSFMDAFDDQVAWRIDRAIGWARLARKANADKRVVFTYWSEGGGKANIGGDPDDFLDVQGSLVRLMTEMRGRGYHVGADPLPDVEALARRMARSASNVGTWAPAELAARVARGEARLIPEATYAAWFDRLPKVRRDEIVEMWGPPPGKVMTVPNPDGSRSLVIPTIEAGNILLAPHPDWGYLQDQKALMSTGQLPPHHQYLAFFLWLQHEWKADAWVSVFTNLSLQPGKSEGPAADDHVALMLGAIPHIHPERLGANGGPSNKRKILGQTVSWYNIVGPSDTREQFFELRAQLGRYAEQSDAALRADAERSIRAEISRTGLNRSVEMLSTPPFDAVIRGVTAHLDALDRSLSPFGSKVLGDAPQGPALAGMVTAMLAPELRAALRSQNPTMTDLRLMVSEVVLDGRDAAATLRGRFDDASREAIAVLARARAVAENLQTAPRELQGILAALDGRFIEPGPMDDPVRRPESLPPGRSLYNFDQAAIPTPEAEAIGVRQAEELIAAHRAKNDNAYPTKQAFVIFSSEIAKNHGVTEAQILHLLGTRPVRNLRGEVTGVELISREALGRPRVDVLVTTSGTYRDHYQDKVDLIAQATRLAAASPEPDNPVAAATRATEASLQSAGMDAARAATLSRARVFAPAAGAYSPNIQFLAKSGDQRGDEAKMAELYTSRLSNAYGDGLYGESARTAFEQNLRGVEGATLPRSGAVNGMLDQPMSAGFLGGLNLAARAVTGNDIDLMVSDLRDPANPAIESAAVAIQKELQTRYFNPAWLKAMQAHRYDGARNMMFLTDHLDLWDSTASSTVTSRDWADVKSVYVEDRYKLGMDGFFDRHNPHAQQVLLANLLAAASRGHWSASSADLAQVAGRLARSAREHGAVCEASICRNPAMAGLVESALASVPGGARMASDYRAAIERATTGSAPSMTLSSSSVPSPPQPAVSAAPAPPAANTVVSGRVLEESTLAGADSPVENASTSLLWVAAVACALLALGALRAP